MSLDSEAQKRADQRPERQPPALRHRFERVPFVSPVDRSLAPHRAPALAPVAVVLVLAFALVPPPKREHISPRRRSKSRTGQFAGFEIVDFKTDIMAEREGFEPSIEFPLYTLSKRAPSTTRPSLRLAGSHQDNMRSGRNRRIENVTRSPISGEPRCAPGTDS